jgi:hypothetical protein
MPFLLLKWSSDSLLDLTAAQKTKYFKSAERPFYEQHQHSRDFPKGIQKLKRSGTVTLIRILLSGNIRPLRILSAFRVYCSIECSPTIAETLLQ